MRHRIDPDEIVIDSVSVHPLHYIAAVGVLPDECYGFVPVEQETVPFNWVVAYRDSPRTAAGRAAPGSAQGPPAIVVDRLYPKIHTWSQTTWNPLDQYLSTYREAVGLRAADTYGVLPLRTGDSSEDSTTIWLTFNVVYRERPEYAQRRPDYAAALRQKVGWPPAEVLPGDAAAPALPPDEGGRVTTEWERLGFHNPFTPRDDMPQHVLEVIEKAGVPPERCYGVTPDNRHKALRLAHTR